MREFFADTPLGGKAQSLTIETQRRFKIPSADSDERNAWLHAIHPVERQGSAWSVENAV